MHNNLKSLNQLCTVLRKHVRQGTESSASRLCRMKTKLLYTFKESRAHADCKMRVISRGWRFFQYAVGGQQKSTDRLPIFHTFTRV